MNKYLLFLFLPIMLSADDLIVDQNSLFQYQENNYLLFDVFDVHNEHLWRSYVWPHGYYKNTDVIDLSDNAPVLGSQFTQEVWVYVDSTTYPLNRAIMSSDSTFQWWWAAGSPTITVHSPSGSENIDEIRYGFGTGDNSLRAIVEVELPVKVWHHIATTFDGTNYKLFINGEEINNYTDAAGFTPYATPTRYIGSTFLGKIDEVRMWNVARTQEEIQVAMNDTLSGDETGLVAYYPMDLNNNWELVDHSSNNNHVPISNTEVASTYSSDNCPAPDGSYDCPYPTIRGALDIAQAGDRVYIREGRYTELLNKWQLNHGDGSEGSKITIEGYPNEDVILDGTASINADWEPYTHNGHAIYKAVLDMNSISHSIKTQIDSIYGVFVDDRYMIPAMQTNFKNPTDPTTGNPNNPEPGTVWSLKLKSPILYPDSADYVPGDLANLDTLEEWSFDPDDNTLYLYASNDFIPTSANVRVRVRNRFLGLTHSDNIEFRNIHFFSGSIYLYNPSYVAIENCKFSFSSEMGLEGNVTVFGNYTTVRNCIFEYINDGHVWYQERTMYPTMENLLFRYNDWFTTSAYYATTTKNNNNDGFGATQWRYITIENSYTCGIYPAMNSLTEYCRFENLYEAIDGSGIQRNPISVPGSTTRYTWIINVPHLNGMRFDGSCAGNNGDVHHVVSVGNSRGFRLKGDYHDAYHLTAYDNKKQDISLPFNKYCGLDMAGENEHGNLNSNIHNSIAQNRLECSSPDCWSPGGDPNGYGVTGYQYPNDPVHLDSVGIWYGLALNEIYSNHIYNAGNAYPHFELMDPWIQNRARSDESLVEQFGTVPWESQIQNYDFRPRKGSNLIDGGVIIPGINDGQDMDFNHPPLYSGENRAFVGYAPDVGAYEYGDSVYWIPGYRYPHPSTPIPSDGAVDVPIDYSLAWNYPYKQNYSGTMAVVTVIGPDVNRTETFQYPNNVLFETFQPGGTYNWSVSVDGMSGGDWTFQVDNKIYPLNDRSIDTTTVDSVLLPYQIKNLEVSNHNLAFLRFDIPSSINDSCVIKLNLVPETVVTLNGGIVIYKYNFIGWGERSNDNNLGIIDHSLLIPLDTLFSLETGSVVSVDLSDVINSNGEHSFSLGVLDDTDSVSFYSKEKMFTDGEYNVFLNGYAPQMAVWPSLSFDQVILSTEEDKILPFRFALYQNYPNPFNPITTIDYEMARDELVSIFVYDLMGRKIKTLVNKVVAPGRYSVSWNGTNEAGKLLSTGMYFYQMRAEGFESVKKLILLK